jgi:hypothetical protein
MNRIFPIPLLSATGVSLNVHEDERIKPENWIPLGWLPILDKAKKLLDGHCKKCILSIISEVSIVSVLLQVN